MLTSIRLCMFGLLAISLLGAITDAESSPRRVIDFNPGWKFIRQDVPQAEQIATDDTAWQAVDLPHTWNNLDGEDGGNNYYRGTGWYRRHLAMDPDWSGKRLYLKFDAASLSATVYVNGKPAGAHSGGFAAFCYDITPLLHATGDNLVAVKVSNAPDPDRAPLSADFTFFGGLYRSVHLLVLDPLAISPIDDGSSGVYVRQDKVDADAANLTVTTMLRNTGADVEHPSVKTELLDANGVTVATATGYGMPIKETSWPLAQAIVIPHPHLWNARKDPYLYLIRTTVSDGTKVTDVVEQSVGFRFFRVDPEKGFFLNGQPYRLYGVNRHQDAQDKGWAISLADHKRDFDNMMEMGCTGVRLSHYQHAQAMYDLCDHGGIIAWAEIPLVNKVTISKEFDDNAAQQLREMIKQNFNHAAICFWGMSNELTAGNKAPWIAQNQHQEELIARLNTEAKQLDPTRLTTQASARGPGNKIDSITDVAGFNRYYGWYNGKPTDWPEQLDKLHEVYPDRALAISEYGGGAAVTQHQANPPQSDPKSKWHPEEWQGVIHENAWAAIEKRPWIWGAFFWCEHDFASDGRNEGDHSGINDKGVVTYDGNTKKDSFYFYKANWSTEPVVYITDRRFTPRPSAEGQVKIYSNCDSVELKLNGKSLGAVPGNDVHVFVWPAVKLNPGENELEATGLRDGKRFSDTCSVIFDANTVNGKPPASAPAK